MKSTHKIEVLQRCDVDEIFLKYFILFINNKTDLGCFPGGTVVENPPTNAGDTGSSPGLGGSHMPRSN